MLRFLDEDDGRAIVARSSLMVAAVAACTAALLVYLYVQLLRSLMAGMLFLVFLATIGG